LLTGGKRYKARSKRHQGRVKAYLPGKRTRKRANWLEPKMTEEKKSGRDKINLGRITLFSENNHSGGKMGGS